MNIGDRTRPALPSVVLMGLGAVTGYEDHRSPTSPSQVQPVPLLSPQSSVVPPTVTAITPKRRIDRR